MCSCRKGNKQQITSAQLTGQTADQPMQERDESASSGAVQDE
jgi:hypothetical protein